MTNLDQDVTLDEMIREIEHFMTDNGNDNLWSVDMTVPSMDVIITNENGKIRRGEWSDSLDVIREVEEALALEGMYQDYYRERRNGGIRKIISVDRDTAKQRLKAIYATLRESGEI